MLNKKVLVLAAVGILAGYCALPMTSVATMTITVTDQNDLPITENAAATFLDAQEREITVVALGALPSWSNNIHWWTHSSDARSHLRPDDVRRTVKIRVDAGDCEPQIIEAALTEDYVAPSLMPHGGGAAFMYYTFARKVRMQCTR